MTDYYDTRFTPQPHRRAVWGHVVDYLQPWIAADGTLIDLAAGYADFANEAAAERRVAIDIHDGILGHVDPGVEPVVGDATDLSAFDDGTVATIFASNFVEHLEHEQIDQLLAEVVRVLRHGGRIILVQPNFRYAARGYFDDYTHRTIWTHHSLGDRLAAAGLVLDRVEPRFLPLTMKSRLSFGHRLVPLYLRLPYRPLAGQMLVIAHRA